LNRRNILIINKTDPRKRRELGGVTTHIETLFSILDKIDWDYELLPVKGLFDYKKLFFLNTSVYDIIYINVSIYDKSILKLLILSLILKMKRQPKVIQFHGGRFKLLKYKPIFKYSYKFIYSIYDLYITLNDDQYIDVTKTFKS